MTKLYKKAAPKGESGASILSEKDFSFGADMHDLHRFQHFATLKLSLGGQEIHVGNLQALVRSRRGLLLGALRSGEMTVQTGDGSITVKPADFVIAPLEMDAVLHGENGELDCLVIDEQLKPLLP